jgi:anhydro-N-acetylmuramic acid kinase
MFKYNIIGVMSGTSMDGLDLAFVNFFKKESAWDFDLVCATTYPYPESLQASLSHSKNLSALEMIALDLKLGTFIGEKINAFISENELNKSAIDAVASHGHTVFHQPEKRLTLQIGHGQEIARTTGIETICDFRTKDVLFGGQGAPLVPVGDRDLYAHKYNCQAFINLGGFANISIIRGQEVSAFDISACNLLLNRYAEKLGHTYDKNGALGRKFRFEDPSLLAKLKALPYYQKEAPKSLGTEWLEQVFLPAFESQNYSSEQHLSLAYQHVSDQISDQLRKNKLNQVFLSGGGAKNNYLIDLIREKTHAELIIPDTASIDFKEAVVFAYLGLLFLENEPNCLSSVTNAQKDVVGGVRFLP